MSKGGKITTREILDRLAAIVRAQAERWPPSVRAPFQAMHAALASRYRTGFMLKSSHKAVVARWVEAVETKGAKAAARPPAITEAWWTPLKLCAGNCGTEVSSDSFACRACHSKSFLNPEDPAARSERSRQAGKVRGAAMRARREVEEEYARRLKSLDARTRAVAEAEARLVPYRPATQLRLPFRRRGKGFDGFAPGAAGFPLSLPVALTLGYIMWRARAP